MAHKAAYRGLEYPINEQPRKKFISWYRVIALQDLIAGFTYFTLLQKIGSTIYVVLFNTLSSQLVEQTRI